MHPKLPDILTNREAPIENELLIRYLKGDLDEVTRHEIEAILTDGHQMEQDAWEGWQQSPEAKNLIDAADEINRKLSRQLHQSQPHKRKRPITELPLMWWAIGLILIMVLMAWLVISLAG